MLVLAFACWAMMSFNGMILWLIIGGLEALTYMFIMIGLHGVEAGDEVGAS